MARATVETGGLDWGDFRALEYFAIIYDIAIDEEQYNPKWCHLKLPEGHTPYDELPNKTIDPDKPWATDRYFLFPDSKSPGDLPDVTISASFDSSGLPFLDDRKPEPPKKLTNGELPFPAPKDGSADQISSLWRKLLLAKYVRAKLQKDGSTTALEALDNLGLALLRAMPLHECEVEWDKLNELQIQRFILKILFLNEAAACYEEFQSISLANDCLNLIKDVVGKGETPYELVALYNKAQGYLHIREHDDALRVFEEVANVDGAMSDQKRDHYFDFETSDNRHLHWPDHEKLFDAYVRYPSVLQCAETLSNLQRSWEAQKRLTKKNAAVPEPATPYQRARRSILIEKIKNDSSPGETAPKWAKDGAEPVNLAFQHLAVDSEWALAKCKLKTADALQALHDDTPSDPTRAIHDALVAFGRAIKKLRTRMRRATKNRSEIDEACLSWAQGLSACKELLLLAKEVSGNDRDRVLKRVNNYFLLGAGDFLFRVVAVDLCIDPVYRDHAVEVRKTLIKNLSSIHDLSGVMLNGFSDLSKQVDACLKTLLAKLILDESKSVPQIERRGWSEGKALLDDKPLPEEDEKGKDPAARHQELRAFISCGFVHRTDDDWALNAAQRETELEVWRNCENRHQCVECGTPAERGGRALDRNPSFTSAESGSKTLHHLDRLVQMNRDTIEERLYQQRKHGNRPVNPSFAD